MRTACTRVLRVARPAQPASRLLPREPRRFASLSSFEARAASYWTSERVAWLNDGLPARKTVLSPDRPGAAALLRVMGLLQPDGKLGSDKLKKYRQINAIFCAIEHALAVPLRDTSSRPLRLLDLCSGSSSHIALLLAFASRFHWERPVHVIAVDADPSRVTIAKQRAALLGFDHPASGLRYCNSTIAQLDHWSRLYAATFAGSTGAGSHAMAPVAPPPDGIFALHACDTATDEAIAYALDAKAATLLIAPCCQAELAAQWKQLAAQAREPSTQAAEAAYASAAASVGGVHAAAALGGGGVTGFSAIHRVPNLRREVGAHVTDAMRLLLIRASGYAASAVEFVPTEHTPKNRLITAARQRRGTRTADDAPARGEAHAGPSWSEPLPPANAMRARERALDEYRALQASTGGAGIALARMLGVE